MTEKARQLGERPAMPTEDEVFELGLPRKFFMNGLTKREYFAAIAMQGLCANVDWRRNSLDIVARKAIEQADALLEELSKEI